MKKKHTDLLKNRFNKIAPFDLGPINPIAQAVTQAIVGAGISLSLSNFAIAQTTQNNNQEILLHL